MSGLFTNDKQGGHIDPAEPATAAAVKQVVAIFTTNDAAHVARDGLVAAGIPRGVVHLIDRADPAKPKSVESRREAFWAALRSLFKSAEDPSMYHLASDPDHALLILQPDAATDMRRAVQILRSCKPFYVFPQLDEAGHLVQI